MDTAERESSAALRLSDVNEAVALVVKRATDWADCALFVVCAGAVKVAVKLGVAPVAVTGDCVGVGLAV